MSRNEQWQLTGDAAELYERYVARYILGPWAPGLVEIAHVKPGERVLDLACGTGVVARLAAERTGPSGRVTGLDLNGRMLSVARALPAPPGAPMNWVQASALDTGLPDASFDAVLCQQGIQFFPDKPAGFREMRRLLVPGGRIAVSVWRTVGTYNTAVGDALARHLGRDVAQRFCASREAPTGEALANFARDAGFDNVALHIQSMIARLPVPEEFVLGHLAATPIASVVLGSTAAVRDAVTADVARTLAPCRDAQGISYAEEISVVTARNGV